MRGGGTLAGVLLAALATGGAGAQQALPAPTPILVVDQDDLFSRSAFGRQLRAELEEASRALSAENRQLEAELTAEERALTDRRGAMPVEEFRQLAADFDAKVVRIRTEREARGRELNRRVDQARKQFLQAALPVLEQVVTEAGAVAMLDSRMVLLSSQAINVTDLVIARLDATLGDGRAAVGAAPGGDAAPAPGDAGAAEGPAPSGDAAPATPEARPPPAAASPAPAPVPAPPPRP